MLRIEGDLFVGKEIDGDILGGYIECGDRRYYIRKGVLCAFPSKLLRRYRRIISAYRIIPPDMWDSSKSDWIGHLRRMQKRLILMGLRLLRRLVGLRILAVGCGAGWEIGVMGRILRGIPDVRIVGCDVALPPMLVAKRRLRSVLGSNVDFVCCPAEFLPFRDKTFDVVTAIFGALDHSLNFPRAFMEISRVLKPRGVLIATMLNRFALDWIAKVIKSPTLLAKTIKYADRVHARIRIPAKGSRVSIPTHFYNILEIKKLIKLSGLSLRYVMGMFSVLPLNFRRRRFGAIHRVLAWTDSFLSLIPPLNFLGRYIGIIAQKA